MISSGLYTAGQVAGLFSVIATCSGCGKADTAVVTLTSPSASQPVLTSLSIAPGSVSLAANATQQFTVSATWSDGSNTVPSLSWSVVGIGSVDQSGFYTASSNAGSAEVIGRHLSSGKADTSFVTITSSAPPAVVGSSGPGPNEPAGMTPVFDNPMSDPLTLTPNAYRFYGFDNNGGSGTQFDRVSVVTESGSTFYRGRTEAGVFSTGGGQGQWMFTAGDQFPQNTGFLYLRVRLRLGGSAGAANFRYDAPWSNKWLSPRHKNVGHNHFLNIRRDTQNWPNPGSDKWGFVWTVQNAGVTKSWEVFRVMDPGKWIEMEILFEPNSPGATDANADGKLTLWLDGVQVWRITNILYVLPGETPAWDRIANQWFYANLFPSTGGIVSQSDVIFDIDHWYASVR